MELTPMHADKLDGGKRAGVNRPAAHGSLAPLPTDIAKTLSYLAHLIDDEIDIRGIGSGVREFAPRRRCHGGRGLCERSVGAGDRTSEPVQAQDTRDGAHAAGPHVCREGRPPTTRADVVLPER